MCVAVFTTKFCHTSLEDHNARDQYFAILSFNSLIPREIILQKYFLFFFDNLKCISKRKINAKTKRNFSLLTTTCQNRLLVFSCSFRLPKINALWKH